MFLKYKKWPVLVLSGEGLQPDGGAWRLHCCGADWAVVAACMNNGASLAYWLDNFMCVFRLLQTKGRPLVVYS